MSLTKETAVAAAKKDLADRLKVDESEIAEKSVTDTEFPDGSLGAPVDGELSMDVIVNGWTITLENAGNSYEYRGDEYQLRLYNFDGQNYVIINS